MTQRPPESFPALRNYFRTRLSDRGLREPRQFRVALSLDRHGARDDGRCIMAQYYPVRFIQGNFRRGCGVADLRRGQLASGRDLSGVSQIPVTSSAATLRTSHQPRRQGRSCGRRGRDRRRRRGRSRCGSTILPIPRSWSACRWRRRRAPSSSLLTSRQGQARRGLRARGQRADRGRQAASARPLRDLIASGIATSVSDESIHSGNQRRCGLSLGSQ